jgi:hypothetical protein
MLVKLLGLDVLTLMERFAAVSLPDQKQRRGGGGRKTFRCHRVSERDVVTNNVETDLDKRASGNLQNSFFYLCKVKRYGKKKDETPAIRQI